MAIYDASSGLDPYGRSAYAYSAANGNVKPGGGYGANDMSGNAASLDAMQKMYGTGAYAQPAGTAAVGVSATGGSASSVSPAIAPPGMTQFQYSQQALQYPTYMRNFGEQTAANNFQSQVTRGIRAGGSGQALTHAQDAQSLARMQNMGLAGQAQVGVEKNQADELEHYQQLMAQLYGTQVQQRGQDLGYQAALAQAAARAQGQTIGGTLNRGGINTGGSMATSGTYTSIPDPMASTNFPTPGGSGPYDGAGNGIMSNNYTPGPYQDPYLNSILPNYAGNTAPAYSGPIL